MAFTLPAKAPTFAGIFYLIMKPKKSISKKVKSIDELTKNYDEVVKGKELNKDGLELFEKVLKKAAKPRGTK